MPRRRPRVGTASRLDPAWPSTRSSVFSRLRPALRSRTSTAASSVRSNRSVAGRPARAIRGLTAMEEIWGGSWTQPSTLTVERESACAPVSLTKWPRKGWGPH